LRFTLAPALALRHGARLSIGGCALQHVPDEMLTLKDLCRFIGGKTTPVDKSSIYRWMREGKIPPPIILGPATQRWRRSEVEKALDALPRAVIPQEPADE
jgi:predicted DNA-binding transcriptional regulator AlpA